MAACLSNTAVTLMEVLLGLLVGTVAAVVLGYAIAKSRLFERLVAPYLVATQAIPIVAIAPLLVIWFGPGMFSKVLICALIVFFPVLVNTVVGVRAVPRPLHDLMGSLHATPAQTLRYLELPAALPILLGGLRIGATLSVIGAVVGELVGADRGLGFLVNVARGQYDTALVFVAVFTLIASGTGLVWRCNPYGKEITFLAGDKRMKKYSWLCIVFSFIGCAACGGKPSGNLTQHPPAAGLYPRHPVRPALRGGGERLFPEAGIQVTFDYSMETDITALVGANQIQFGVVSGEQVLLARAQGLPIVYVAAWYQQYPVSVVAKSDQNIHTPADLRGKTIGLPGLYGANYIGLRALLHAGGLSESDVKLDSIKYTQVEALATGRDQAVSVYTNNEPVQLRAQGYDLTELRVADYIQLASNGLITNEKTISENPDLVRRMVKAFLQGLADTIADPAAAYETSKAYVENLAQLDAAVQKQKLATSIELWKADRLGYSQTQSLGEHADGPAGYGPADPAAGFIEGLIRTIFCPETSK